MKLSYCKLLNLTSNSFIKTTNLQYLYISKCSIYSIELNIPSLVDLTITYCSLSTIDLNFPLLDGLDLSGNDLSTVNITKMIKTLVSLKHLRLNSCNIHNISTQENTFL